ncbi:MAG: HEAT repeat domain-containing protein [Bryobacteraceae bacterium]
MQTNAKQAPVAVEPPPEFRAEKILLMDSPQLVAVLKDPAATEFQKMKACQRLAVIGTNDAVPVLAAMLSDPKMAHYARLGLGPLPDPSADDALRAATAKLKGTLLVGVIDTIGNRRDVKAVPILTKYLYRPDTDVARAAAAALGQISGPSATKALQEAVAKAKGVARAAAAEACLVSAEGLLAQNDRKGALAIYTFLMRADVQKPVRLAAMHNTIELETALNRPR